MGVDGLMKSHDHFCVPADADGDREYYGIPTVRLIQYIQVRVRCTTRWDDYIVWSRYNQICDIVCDMSAGPDRVFPI